MTNVMAGMPLAQHPRALASAAVFSIPVPAARMMGFVVPVRPGAALIAAAAQLMALAAVMG